MTSATRLQGRVCNPAARCVAPSSVGPRAGRGSYRRPARTVFGVASGPRRGRVDFRARGPCSAISAPASPLEPAGEAGNTSLATGQPHVSPASRFAQRIRTGGTASGGGPGLSARALRARPTAHLPHVASGQRPARGSAPRLCMAPPHCGRCAVTAPAGSRRSAPEVVACGACHGRPPPACPQHSRAPTGCWPVIRSPFAFPRPSQRPLQFPAQRLESGLALSGPAHPRDPCPPPPGLRDGGLFPLAEGYKELIAHGCHVRSEVELHVVHQRQASG